MADRTLRGDWDRPQMNPIPASPADVTGDGDDVRLLEPGAVTGTASRDGDAVGTPTG